MKNKFTSKQVSEETGLSIHTLRYYEQIGLIDGIARDAKGYRQYSESDIAWFQVIKYFREMGMPIHEMQQYVALHNSEFSTVTARREFMETYREKVVNQMKELEEMLERVDYKIVFFKNLENASN
ncbi:MerR family transcriptional regulator [Paenibacillus sp. TAB 01]|uniref:MerR family transcriptional regulator n=1 Tax=Paenibacillus sp. TAB 01 TaxID=3368988 RepID=UPI003753478E